MAKRAYDREDKQMRREEILNAARRLFADGNGDLPSAGDIATAASLGKGTVYLYFSTKEAIFAALLLEGWGAVLDGLDEAFSGARAGPEKVAIFLTRFVRYTEDHPELLRLDALGHGVVERNLDATNLHAFKSALTERLMRGGTAVDRALRLPAGRGLQLLMRTYAMTRGLWQSIDPAGQVDCGGAGFPLHIDFAQELLEALAEYWSGALSGRAYTQRLLLLKQ